MFTNTNDFKKAMFEILKAVLNSIKFPFNLEAKYDEDDIIKALERCINLRLIDGLSIKCSGDHTPILVKTKKQMELTYEGLEFLENFQN